MYKPRRMCNRRAMKQRGSVEKGVSVRSLPKYSGKNPAKNPLRSTMSKNRA